MQLEDIIYKITKQRKDLTKKEILDRIDSKKKEAQGLLSDEGAARIVAQELFVKVNGKSFNQIKLKDLVTNLNDITLTVRVIAVWPIKEFKKSNGNIGKILRIVLADKTGTIRCVLWNGKAEQLTSEGDILGKILRLSHAYTREDLTGAPEINCGDRCEIMILPSEFGDDEFPELSTFFKKNLGDIKVNDTEVNIIATVNSKPEITNFKNNNGEGSIIRFSITDGTTTLNLVSWNDKIELLKGIRLGNNLQIVSAQIREDSIKKPEIHIGKGSIVTILNTPSQNSTKLNFSRVTDLNSGKILTLLVRVVNKGGIREFTRKDGNTSKYGSLLVGDNTGLIRLFLWDEKTDIMNEINQDDILLIENSQIKKKADETFISINKSGIIKLNPKISNTNPPSYPDCIPINEINDLSRPVIIEGIVKELFFNDIQLSNGEVVKVANIILNDDNSRVKVSFWRKLADDAVSLKSGMKIRITGIQPKLKTDDQISMSSSDLTTFIVIENNSNQTDKSGLISHYL